MADASKEAQDIHQSPDADVNGSEQVDTISERLRQLDVHEPMRLKEEILRLQDERDALEEQYTSLLEKLSQMRMTLGDRLQQDAEELDRRDQQIEQLTQQVSDLEARIHTLKEELGVSNDEARQLTHELEQMRAQLSNTTQKETAELHRLESRCRDLENKVHAHRVDVDRLETVCIEERSLKEECQVRVQHVSETLDHARLRIGELEAAVEQEKQVARQMQQTLEELQHAQDDGMQRSVSELQQQVDEAESEVEKYKLQVHSMESIVDEAQQATSKCRDLEQELKEKHLLIGKLRHEAVILNEHLKHALGRLRRDSPEDYIDRRLISNLLLQFLSTPRADTKRYEMLRLIASILQWDDTEREKAGLQRQLDRSQSSSYGFWGFGGRDTRSPRDTEGDESVSNLFVEFLLSEVERGKTDRAPS